MKICTNKTCSSQGKPQPEYNFQWHILNVRRKARCKDCTNSKERKRMKVKYKNEREIERAGATKEGLLFNQLIMRKW